MEFSEIVLEHLRPLFVRYNLKIVEHRNNFLKLVCDALVIGISYNHFERSNMLWIGRKENEKYSTILDNQVLREFFNSDLELSQTPSDTFIKNLVIFFNREGQPLLMGDKKMMHDLEQYDAERSRKYTDDLLQKQNLLAADKAWSENNYEEFIKIIDQTSSVGLPSSYELKYKIAKKKV